MQFMKGHDSKIEKVPENHAPYLAEKVGTPQSCGEINRKMIFC